MSLPFGFSAPFTLILMSLNFMTGKYAPNSTVMVSQIAEEFAAVVGQPHLAADLKAAFLENGIFLLQQWRDIFEHQNDAMFRSFKGGYGLLPMAGKAARLETDSEDFEWQEATATGTGGTDKASDKAKDEREANATEVNYLTKPLFASDFEIMSWNRTDLMLAGMGGLDVLKPVDTPMVTAIFQNLQRIFIVNHGDTLHTHSCNTFVTLL